MTLVQTEKSSRGREYGLMLMLLTMGAVGLVVSYGAAWVSATMPVFEGEPTPTTQVSFTGQNLIGFGSAAGWVALTAVAGVLATRTWGRSIVGAITVVAGATAGVAGFTFIFTRDALVSAALDSAVAASVQTNAWWLVAALSGIAVVTAGMMVMLRGRSWPHVGKRYERAGAAGAAVTSGPATAAEVWDALDEGIDPTEAERN
jgi:uncharacterized membrane protein (TIGR02234 family)